MGDQYFLDAAIGGADEFPHRAAIRSFAEVTVKPARNDYVSRIAHDEDDLLPAP
jgi:hypothetical protein